MLTLLTVILCFVLRPVLLRCGPPQISGRIGDICSADIMLHAAGRSPHLTLHEQQR